MSIQRLGLLLCTALLTSCTWIHWPTPAKPKVTPPDSIITVSRDVGTFRQLAVYGPAVVNLHTGSRTAVILKGYASDMPKVSTVVKGQQLLVMGYPTRMPFTIDITTPHINRVVHDGEGALIGHGLKASPLDVIVKNSGTTKLDGRLDVRLLSAKGTGTTEISGLTSRNLMIKMRGNPELHLSGMASLEALDVEGEGRLSFYWVKSNNFIMRAKGEALIQLAGLVDRLDVELWDKVHFSGRFLRSKRAFVKTHDDSIADISAIEHQHTLATDHSNIYFYNLSELKTDFMDEKGSVLDMRDWDGQFWKDYTRYNK